MNTWRITSRLGDRWIDSSGAGDPSTLGELHTAAGLPVERGPGLGTYPAAGPSDPVWLYLAARHIVPDPQVAGTPPQIPAPEGTYRDDVVF